MKKIIIILFLLISSVIFCDQIDLLSSYWDFYSVNYNEYFSLGLGMAPLAEINDNKLSLLNPASIDIKKQSITTSIGYKNKIMLADSLQIKGRLPIIFASYGFDWKKSIDFSAGFETTKSFQIENTLDSQIYLKNKKLFLRENTYYLNCNFKKFKFFRIGANFIIKTLVLDEDTKTAYIDRYKKTYLTYKLGFIIIPLKNLAIATTYFPKYKLEMQVLNSDDETFSKKTKIIPYEINAGISYKIMNFKIYYRLEMKKTSLDFYLTKDKLDHHSGILFNLKNRYKFLLGFFTNNSAYNKESFEQAPDLPEIHNEFFISGGMIIHNENVSFGLSISDSHFSNAYTPKTYISMGFSYQMESLF